MVNKYHQGRIAKKKVVNWLKEKKFKIVRRNKGSIEDFKKTQANV